MAGFKDFVKITFKLLFSLAFWIFGGIIVIIIGASLNYALTIYSNNPTITKIGSIANLVMMFIGILMIVYGYYRYRHSIHIRRERYEI